MRILRHHGRLAAAAFVVSLLVACGPAPTPSAGPSDPATTPPASAPVTVDDTLILRLVEIGDVSGPYPVAGLSVFADGRVITPSTDGSGLWSERRLAADGVATLVEHARSTGLFEASADYIMARRPDAPEPPGHGAGVVTITLRDAAEAVVVSGTGWMGDEYEATYNMPSPERRALSELAGELHDLGWLPESAWSRPEPTAYRSTAYLLVTTWSLGGDPNAVDVSQVRWPFDEPLHEHGVELLTGIPVTVRCSQLDRVAAEGIYGQITALTGDAGVPLEAGFFANLKRAPDAGVDVVLVPLEPDGFPACGDLLV